MRVKNQRALTWSTEVFGLFCGILLLQWPSAAWVTGGHLWYGVAWGQFVAIGIPSVGYLLWRRPLRPSLVAFRPSPWMHTLGMLLCTVVLATLVDLFAGWMHQTWGAPLPFVDRYRAMIQWRDAWHGALVVGGLAIAPALCEEVFFRGICQGVFTLTWGARGGLILSSAFFAIAHGSVWYFPLYFLLGLYLGVLHHRSGGLLWPILAHAVNNAWTLILHQ